MEFSREKIIGTLEKMLERPPFRKLHFAEMYAGAPLGETEENELSLAHFRHLQYKDMFTGKGRISIGSSFPCPRISCVLDGELSLNVGSGKEIREINLHAGETLVMKPYCIVGVRWESSHEVLGLVLAPEYLRLVHSIYTHPAPPLHGPDHFYHLTDSLRRATTYALNAACSLSEGPEADRIGPSMLENAFALLLADMKKSSLPDFGKARSLWTRIVDTIAASPETVTRKQLAAHFRITETYVSRLFSTCAGMTFKEYLRNCRMNKALQMLEETPLTIEEIAWSCGFQSTSHFIYSFRLMHKISPGLYRRLKK
ncbi:MAG: Transposon Tn10 TetD protein [Lentisphaerae bacterium ADurb.Bin242]|nr:MAG: Transposon Tn10 TetD protein [Lentisphaerae bacterium ADurb.Bin242]